MLDPTASPWLRLCRCAYRTATLACFNDAMVLRAYGGLSVQPRARAGVRSKVSIVKSADRRELLLDELLDVHHLLWAGPVLHSWVGFKVHIGWVDEALQLLHS